MHPKFPRATTTICQPKSAHLYTMDVLTPKEYLSVEDCCAALTAHNPTTREMISFNYTTVSHSTPRLVHRSNAHLRWKLEVSGHLLTIWKASAISARLPTHIPVPSSRTKNAASMPSIMEIRVDFDHAIVKDA